MNNQPPTDAAKRSTRRRIALVIVAAALLCGIVVFAWLRRHPQPLSTTSRPLYQGITYRLDVRTSPRRLVIHVITVDLTAPGLSFLVTPPASTGPRPLRGQTTSSFLHQYGVQVAVNGDYFYPFRSHTVLDYYPHAGDPVSVEGVAASRGVIYSGAQRTAEAWKIRYPTLYISKDNQASFRTPIGLVYNAVSGNSMILRDGRNIYAGKKKRRHPEPCTSVALDKTGKTMWIVVVDGRQPGYSDGLGMEEFGELLRSYGAWSALDLDGGGSESLVVEGPRGAPQRLNRPMDCGIPGRERVVANHLGVFALPLKSTRNNTGVSGP